jgi:large subunit ribosomal protein L9
MEIVLLERIEKLGIMGDVVSVKDGFARNYLLPQGKALRATKENLASFEEQRAQLEARNLEQRKEAEAVAARMEDASIVVVRQASESDHLYGSVSMRDIADSLSEAGYTVDRKQVALDHPIKTIGLTEIRVVLHPEVSVMVQVNVARSEEEAQAAADALVAEAVFETEELAQQAVETLEENDSEAEGEAVEAGAETDEAADAEEESEEEKEA